jgi:hypothetical protein
MSNAIYLDGEWNKVDCCTDCSIEYPQYTYESGYDDCCNHAGEHTPDSGFLETCPLPDWDTVRPHSMKEKPKPGVTVNVKLIDTNLINGKTTSLIRTGQVTRAGSWVVHGYGLAQDFKSIELIEWRHILNV